MQDLRVATEPPQPLAIGISRPRERQRAADEAKQHPEEEPAKVRGNPGTERQHNREQRIEGSLSGVEPEQDSAEQQHHRNEVAGEPLDPDMNDKRYRTPL